MSNAPKSTTDLNNRPVGRILAGTLCAVFLAALDQTIIATSGPVIQAQLGLSAGQYSWLTTSYLVAATLLVPVYGRLSDGYGRRAMLLWGISLFGLGSTLCGLASGLPMLLAGRLVQGSGAAALLSMSFALIADLFPPQERGKYTGLIGATFGVASLLGPIVGGVMATRFGWPSVFWINVPAAALAYWAISTTLPAQTVKGTMRFDGLGALGLALMVVPMVLRLSTSAHALSSGERQPNLQDIGVDIGLSLIGILSGFALLRLSNRRHPTPLIPLARLQSTSIRLTLFTVMSAGALMFAPIIFLPLYYTQVLHVPYQDSGWTLIPFVLLMSVGNAAAGRLVSRTGHHVRIAAGALLLMAIGFGVFILNIGVVEGAGWRVLKLAPMAFGMAGVVPVFTLLMQRLAAQNEVGLLTSMVSLCRQIGATLGTAMLSAVFAFGYARAPLHANPEPSLEPLALAAVRGDATSKAQLLERDLPGQLKSMLLSGPSASFEGALANARSVLVMAVQSRLGAEELAARVRPFAPEVATAIRQAAQAQSVADATSQFDAAMSGYRAQATPRLQAAAESQVKAFFAQHHPAPAAASAYARGIRWAFGAALLLALLALVLCLRIQEPPPTAAAI